MRFGTRLPGAKLTLLSRLRAASGATNRQCLFLFGSHAYIMQRCSATRCSILTSIAGPEAYWNVQKRAILNIAPSSARRTISVDKEKGRLEDAARNWVSNDLRLHPLILSGRDILFNQSATKANKSLEPPLPYPGATPDSERAKQPPLPEPPYKPYAEKPPLPGPPYEPYSKKSPLPESPYEPYAKKAPLSGPPYEPYKGM